MSGNESSWQVGDLVWARFGKHPFWPGLVTDDPETKDCKRVKAQGPRLENQITFHVSFFGDNGQRSWVTMRNCFSFTGRETEIPQLKNIIVKKRFKERWELAVLEAESLIDKSREERLNEFQNILESSRKETEDRKLKRSGNSELSMEQNGLPALKKRKVDADAKSKESKRAPAESLKSTRRSKIKTEICDPEFQVEEASTSTKEQGDTTKQPKQEIAEVTISSQKKSETALKASESGSLGNKQEGFKLPSGGANIKQEVLSSKDSLVDGTKTVKPQKRDAGKETEPKSKSTAAKRVLFSIDVNQKDAAEAGSSKDSPKPGSSKKDVPGASSKKVAPARTSTGQSRKRAIKYSVGDIVWARFGKYPYWPCMLANEPSTGLLRKQSNGQTVVGSSPLLHVQFYGDRGRRSWVPANHVMPFEGLAAFTEQGKTVPSKNKKERNAYHVKQSYREAWNTGVAEATSFLSKSSDERQKFFTENFPYQDASSKRKSREIKSASKENKHKVETKEELTVAMRGTKKSPESKKNVATPRPGCSSENVPQRTPRRSRKKLTASQLTACFEAFKTSTYDMVKKQYPSGPEEQVQQILLHMWESKTDEQKAMFLHIVEYKGGD